MTRTVAPVRTLSMGVLVIAALALAGCGSSAGGSGGSGGGGGAAGTSLTITAKASPDSAVETWTLTCDPAGGTHPDPAAACAVLASAQDPFKPVPKDVACTEIYGGPQTATVTGTYKGQPVNATFNRTNGCEIARWNALAEVLVVQGGA